jgi:hypothetical protein
MTVVVNLRSEEEEKALYAFLDSLHYDYQSTPDEIELSAEQQSEILRRDKAFIEGKTCARDWEEIQKELEIISH